jgi:DNA-binding NarL/FixJ family response regulator
MTISVFLADDHAIVVDGLRALLETSREFTVTGIADNGRKAVEEVQRLQPDVAVLDIAMPDMGGIEATRRIVDKCPKSRVLILSMFMSSEHVFRALRSGALGYVLKESAGAELMEAIHKVHAGQRYLSHRITEALVGDFFQHKTNVSPLDSLSLRERDVLQQVVEGYTNAVIAENLSISTSTVETYRARILKKLKLKDTVELIKFAMRLGLIA